MAVLNPTVAFKYVNVPVLGVALPIGVLLIDPNDAELEYKFAPIFKLPETPVSPTTTNVPVLADVLIVFG